MAGTVHVNSGCELSLASRLPDDVLVCTFEFLSLAQLRSVAGVSRKFYGAAWRSGLYIHRKITDWHYDFQDFDTLPHTRFLVRSIITWNELLDHALEKHLRVAFTLEWNAHGALMYSQRAESLALLEDVLDSITRALPILVSLSITMLGLESVDLCEVLKDPAPFLRSLFLHSSRYDGPLGPFTPSSGLFSGNAPHLQELGLDYRSLGQDPLPVFSNIVRFSTQDCDLGAQVDLARHFPKLAHLLISDDEPAESQIPPAQVDLSGLTLRSFVYHNTTSRADARRARERTPGPGFPATLAFHHIVDEGQQNGLRSLSLGWRNSRDGLLALHLPCTRWWFSIRVMALSADESWRRSYILREYCGHRELFESRDIAAKLGYLRISCWQAISLVARDTQLVALRRLRVDVTTGPQYGSTKKVLDSVEFGDLEDEHDHLCRLRCPVLETVALLWMCDAPEEHATLDRVDIYILGRTLGSGDTKPVLELGDIERDRPLTLPDESEFPDENQPAVNIADVFSAVRRVPCVRGVILDRFDGEEWNDHAALEADKYLKQSLAW